MEEFTVSSLSARIKQVVEGNFNNICLHAEVSALKLHSSGHLYFTLKDADAIIDAVCWKWVAAKQKIKLEDGLMVKCIGQVTTYRSRYQFVVQSVELEGIGALLQMLEERKKKLTAEGLFDSSKKKNIPKIPKLIGVITSPTGAVIKDIMHRLTQRFPRDVLLWPVAVQGPGAAEQIAHAISGMNNLPDRPDVLIVARGGGSFEELMPFNEEVVVRAVASSEIPIISAVGHETDTTLIDYASDLRAPTPTAAAEFAVPERIELSAKLSRIFSQLSVAISSKIERNRLALNSYKILNPQNIFIQKAQPLDFLFERLVSVLLKTISAKKVLVAHINIAVPKLDEEYSKVYQKLSYLFLGYFEKLKMQIGMLSQNLESNSYTKILKKGFTLVETHRGRLISSAKDAESQAEMNLIFTDGKITVSKKPTQSSLF